MFEIIVEFIVQVVGELLVELFGRAFGRILETRIGRWIMSAAVMAAIGYGGGYAWGRHVADIGEGVPRTIWVSLALAVLASVLALKARSDPDAETRFASLPATLRPTAQRLALLSFRNVTLAIGVTAGYNA